MEDKNDISAIAKAYAQAYYLAHPEELAAHRKAKKRDHMKKWRAANPDKAKAKNRAASKKWRDAHPDKAKAKNKAWSDANPDYHKDWQVANPDYSKDYRAENKQIILDHYNNKCNCPTCKSGPNVKLEVDHIIPFAEGPHKHGPRGGTAIYSYIIKHQCWEDFQILCKTCNSLKHHNGNKCNCGEGLPNILEKEIESAVRSDMI